MIPRLAVVGHPNKGKSSIVATLVETGDIPISNLPGTTTKSQVYPMKIGQEVLYELADTPGFQRPRKVLLWLQRHSRSADDRPNTVAQFVAQHKNDPEFHDECELLQPLIEGAGILYVVDGSKPYGSEYEAEMEILRWTGRPRMALINMIGNSDFAEEWRRALDQYFGLVRVFNAVRADASKRIALLQSFAELSEEWQPALQHAVKVLQKEWSQRTGKSAAVIAKLLIAVLTEKLVSRIDPEADVQPAIEKLGEKLKNNIRRLEQNTRKEVEYLYRYQHIEREESSMNLLELDLFSDESVQLFGLSRTQLIASGAASGAAAGLGIDAALGGASLLLGSGIGAVIGGASALFGSERLSRLKKYGLPLARRNVTVGPVKDSNLPWVLLGRAILHQRLISERNHALRDKLILDATASQHITESIPQTTRRELDHIFASIRKRGHDSQHNRLVSLIDSLLRSFRPE